MGINPDKYPFSPKMNIPTSKKGLLDAIIGGTKKLRREIVDFLLKNTQNESNIKNNPILNPDESIIEVTGDSYKIDQLTDKINQPTESQVPHETNLTTYKYGVPVWSHQYVYSFSEINQASKSQREFYTFYKNSFSNGVYLDLEGNTNYCFILLFDFLNTYESHRNISKLEGQLKLLGQFYPKTKSYGLSFLIEKMEATGNKNEVARLYDERQDYYNYWRLGNKYKKILNLRADEIKLLNRLTYPNNNFSGIEYCRLQIIKLFLATIKELSRQYELEKTKLDDQFSVVTDLIARKQFRYRLNSQNYKYEIESSLNEIYSNLFKYCENAVREYYGHKRKLNIETNYTNPEVIDGFENIILEKLKKIISKLIIKISLPDEATEVELNSQNTTRWKIKFEEITKNYTTGGSLFIDEILFLGKLNRKNPSVENVFFEASKFISKIDREASLSLYIYYLYYDLKSASFDNKQLTKTIQKSLFKTNEQLRDFEIIISEFIKDRNLEKALKGIPKIYEVKRRKIQLDSASIKEVQQQHSGTVELLNEYLKDEYEDDAATIKTEEINLTEVKIEITPKDETAMDSGFLNEIAFSPIQVSTLNFFAKSNFLITQNDLETFAKSNGSFKNQLIESINEICYETLDDILIEEEEDYYTINLNYYRKILQNDR